MPLRFIHLVRIQIFQKTNIPPSLTNDNQTHVCVSGGKKC